MRRGRLLAYARWQARDIASQRLVAYALVAFFFVVPLIFLRFDGTSRPDPAGYATVVFGTIASAVSLLGFTGPLIAINGILSTDRERGYYRLYFAKPVSPLAFYVQDFLLSGLLLVATTAALLAILRLTLVSTFYGGGVLHVALGFALWGSIGFFFSTFLKHDWMGTLLAGGLAQVAGTLADRHIPGVQFLLVILPPLKAEFDTVAPMVRGTAPNRGDVLWVLGYGMVFFLLAILVLKRRPIGA